MLQLKSLLQKNRITQADLARHLDLSQGALAQIVNHGHWPKHQPRPTLEGQITSFLIAKGVSQADLAEAFEPAKPTPAVVRQAHHARDAHPEPNQGPHPNPEESMLLRKQALTPSAMKHFSMLRSPFKDEIQCHEDLWMSPDIRYAREALLQTAKHGGLLALVAESGAGKTVLMRDLEDRFATESQPILMIRPYVLAMEDSDTKGKTLKASHIAEAILAEVAPLERLKSSPQARFAQLHRALKESYAAGHRHCLVIEEAHSLPIPTLNHLKRFFELELGFKKLLSIILIGQPELKQKLSERDLRVREIVQRCEMVELMPVDPGRLTEFLRFKFDRVGKQLDEVITEGGIDALHDRLTIPAGKGAAGRRDDISLLYPLAIANLLAACMNLAADLGAPLVTAEVVRGL